MIYRYLTRYKLVAYSDTCKYTSAACVTVTSTVSGVVAGSKVPGSGARFCTRATAGSSAAGTAATCGTAGAGGAARGYMSCAAGAGDARGCSGAGETAAGAGMGWIRAGSGACSRRSLSRWWRNRLRRRHGRCQRGGCGIASGRVRDRRELGEVDRRSGRCYCTSRQRGGGRRPWQRLKLAWASGGGRTWEGPKLRGRSSICGAGERL